MFWYLKCIYNKIIFYLISQQLNLPKEGDFSWISDRLFRRHIEEYYLMIDVLGSWPAIRKRNKLINIILKDYNVTNNFTHDLIMTNIYYIADNGWYKWYLFTLE